MYIFSGLASKFEIKITSPLGRGIPALFLILFVCGLIPAEGHAAEQDGAVDPTFKSGSGFNNSVEIIVPQNNGKILVAGKFITYNSTARRGFARLNADGSVDTAFNHEINKDDSVSAMASQTDNKVLLAFRGARLRRLNQDGSFDTSFNAANNHAEKIVAMALQSDGKILIGGSFTSYGNVSYYKIARVNTDGTPDVTFQTDDMTRGDVQAIALQSDGKILIGGKCCKFSRLNSNGSTDTSFNTGSLDGEVASIKIQNDAKILIGGKFTSYNNVVRQKLARLNSDGSLDTAFTSPIPAGEFSGYSVSAINLQNDGKILIGGYLSGYTQPGSNYFKRLNPDGTLDSSFNPGTGPLGIVRTILTRNDGKTIIGGDFGNYNGIGTNYFARVNSDGTLDATFTDGTGVDSGTYGGIKNIKLQNDGKLLISGWFHRYNGANREFFARLNADGTLDTGFDSHPNNPVITMAAQSDGKVLIGGEFSMYNNTYKAGLARLNNDGSPDGTFAHRIFEGGVVHALAIQPDGKIIIGGKFYVRNDFDTWINIARLNTDGSVDTTFKRQIAPNDIVNIIELQNDGKILIGGLFTTYNNVTRNHIARLNTDGTLDTTFDPGSGATDISVIAVQNDKIVIGGFFTNYNGTTVNRMARLNSDGSLDSSFNAPELVKGITDLALQADGKVIAVGDFLNPDDPIYNPRDYIGRFNGDGSVDTTFNHTIRFYRYLPHENIADVRTVALQSNGKIVVGGTFSAVGSYTRDGLVRLENSVCNPLLVTSNSDNGQASSCGLLSYALATATSGSTISFALPTGTNTINFSGTLTPTLKSGVTLSGGANGVILDGSGTIGDGLRLGGNNFLTGLTIRGFSGRQLVVQGGLPNRFYRVKVESQVRSSLRAGLFGAFLSQE